MNKVYFQLPNLRRLFLGLFLVITVGSNGLLIAADSAAESDTEPRVIRVELGDYHFMPGELQLVVGQPVVLQLVNTDSLTPHNFTLEDPSNGLDVNVDVTAGETVEVHLMPLWPGRHTFYCGNKMIFMDSHRDKGMQGSLLVVPK